MTEPQCFISDDDSHWYLIPEKLRDRFQELISDEDHNTFVAEFDQYACSNPRFYIIHEVIPR